MKVNGESSIVYMTATNCVLYWCVVGSYVYTSRFICNDFDRILLGNHYGTPKPPSEPKGPNLRRSTSMGTALPNSGDNKRRRNRSNTEGGSARSSPVSFQYDGERKKSMDRMQVDASLGSLPQNWEKAFTEEGIPYFIE